MRSSRSAGLLLVAALAACGTDSVARDDDPVENEPTPVDPDVCETSYLDYENFGAPFVINWCRGCHSSAVPANMRQKAPKDANFDNVDQVRMWAERIANRATGTSPSMPPAGGPTHEERLLLAEWVACGAK
jgi:uncharacterized membrane protein